MRSHRYKLLLGKRCAACLTMISTAVVSLYAQAPVSVEGDGELRDIEGPIDIPLFTKGEWIALWTVFALVVLLLSWVLLRYLRRKSIQPIPSPSKVALQEIDTIAAQINRTEDQVFCTALSDAVRHFIERELAIPAPEITTEEFFTKFSKHPQIPDRSAQKLEKFLSLCDQVKFAQKRLSMEERRFLAEEARSIVLALNRLELDSKEHTAL